MRKQISHVVFMLLVMSTPLVWAKDSPKTASRQPEKVEGIQPSPQLEKGLDIDLWYGGWEPDYTKTAAEVMFSYRAIDKFHLFAGLGNSKQVYYDRFKVYAGGYYFYEDYSFFRMSLAERKYKYPTLAGAVAPNPDSNSYETVPRLELEISQYFDQSLRGGLSYELSRPNFYHDKNKSIVVHKLGGEIVHSAHPKFSSKYFASLLRDPDPNTTEIRGFDNPLTATGVATSTEVQFKTTTLFGAAIKYAEQNWDMEVKYMQNRDLDNSYDYSLLNKFVYRIDTRRTLQFDHVYDVYSSQSNLRGQSGNVYLASYYKQLSPGVRYGFGLKHIAIPGFNENTSFLYLQYKTGVVW